VRWLGVNNSKDGQCCDGNCESAGGPGFSTCLRFESSSEQAAAFGRRFRLPRLSRRKEFRDWVWSYLMKSLAEVLRKETPRGESPRAPDEPNGRRVLALCLTTLGVVYGDIGTSPLYALKECFHGAHAITVSPGNVLGVLSLIFWSLVIVISIKYLVFILRADNQGEGGILALASLATPFRASATGGRWLLIILGLFGASLLYGDGMITPAISVLSAVEGLHVATPLFEPYIIPVTIGILIGLFLFQRRGTARVGAVFGPVTLIWFVVIGVFGALTIVGRPEVLAAVNPLRGIEFFAANGGRGFLVLGTVFLVVTGGEALYADMGHFGARPIRIVWFSLVLPALLLNYFGQGALLISDPSAAANPFYRMAPRWALYPLVILATAATVIASQAVISGAFSLTRQAMQLGYCPRLLIEHTSAEQIGQIYIPVVNGALMLACIGLVLGFRSSSNLASAYGVAVTTTMVITTILFFVVMRHRWKWNLPLAVSLCGFFLIIDSSFFAANTLKIWHGGWFPLVVAAGVFTMLTTWKSGRRILAANLQAGTQPLEAFVEGLKTQPIVRVPGTAVFMYGSAHGTPPALLRNVKHNKMLHGQNVILTVETEEVPRVPERERLEAEKVREGFYRVVIHYGFVEDPDVSADLGKLTLPGLDLNLDETSFFLSRERLIATEKPGMALWREKLFARMSRNARSATSFFGIPPDRVVELGAQIEL
jgi:KUP system potassium uptake protein